MITPAAGSETAVGTGTPCDNGSVFAGRVTTTGTCAIDPTG